MLTSDQSFKKCVVVDGMQYVTEMQFELVNTNTIISNVCSLCYTLTVRVCPISGERREESLYSEDRILGRGRRRVAEIRYNGEQGNYWDHSHNRGRLRSGVSKDIIFITKC